MQICELKVPVPWGHIAIKAWGDYKDEAVILLHGLLDNAGTFDTLIPLLPQNFYYICVDLPGHGLSSHFPTVFPIEYINYIFVILAVTEHFNREKYVFLGHSFGGRLSLLFTQVFPNLVSKIAVLDVGYTPPNPPERFIPSLISAYETFKKTLSFKPEHAPSYSYEEVIHKIIDSRFIGTLTFETAEQLAQRMIKQVGDDKYEFTYDKRLRKIIYPSFSQEYIKDMFKKYPIKCPAIAIYCTNTKKLLRSRRNIRAFLYLPNFKFFEVDGHHHSHHTNPELFAPILKTFLLKQKNKL